MRFCELSEVTDGAPNFPNSLFRLFYGQFFEVLDPGNGFNFYEPDEREDALEHLKQQRAKLDEEIAAFEGKRKSKR